MEEDCKKESWVDALREWGVLFGDEITKGYAGISWTIKGIMPCKGVGYLYGPSGVGKTFLALYLAKKIAYAREHPEKNVQFFGHKILRGARVFYLCYGANDGGNVRRLFALNQEYQWADDEHSSFRLVLSANRFLLFGDADKDDRQDKDGKIEQLVGALPSGSLLIIDSLCQAALGADLNSSRDASLILERCRRLAEKMQGTVLLIAHTGKDAEKKLAGSEVQTDLADFVLELKDCSTEDERIIQVIVEKQRDAATSSLRFALKRVPLQGIYGEDGEQEYSLIVSKAETDLLSKQPTKQSNKKSGNTKKAPK